MTEFVKARREIDPADAAALKQGVERALAEIAGLDPANIEALLFVVKTKDGVGPQGQDVLTAIVGDKALTASLIEHSVVQMLKNFGN